jgi:hypothetical protein
VTNDQNSVNSLYLKIGDKVYNYQDLMKYRTHTVVFNVTLPDKGIMGVTQGGPSKGVVDGFYIITQLFLIQDLDLLLCAYGPTPKAQYIITIIVYAML